MSWEELLKALDSPKQPYTHNSHNTQNSLGQGSFADIADSASRDPEQEASKLMEVLATVCKEVDITPLEVKAALSKEDIDDWRKGHLNADALAAFAGSLVQQQEMEQGERPDHYTEHATCDQCSPVWLWRSGNVTSCPWCWNRSTGKPIPRPSPVHCGACRHFQRTNHPNLGHCAQGKPEPIVGLWDSDRRYCEAFHLSIRLEVGNSEKETYAHNTHNTQNPSEADHQCDSYQATHVAPVDGATHAHGPLKCTALWLRAQGVEPLSDDIPFMNRYLPRAPKRRSAVLWRYVKAWREAADTGSLPHRKANAGRHAANTKLRKGELFHDPHQRDF